MGKGVSWVLTLAISYFLKYGIWAIIFWDCRISSLFIHWDWLIFIILCDYTYVFFSLGFCFFIYCYLGILYLYIFLNVNLFVNFIFWNARICVIILCDHGMERTPLAPRPLIMDIEGMGAYWNYHILHHRPWNLWFLSFKRSPLSLLNV